MTTLTKKLRRLVIGNLPCGSPPFTVFYNIAEELISIFFGVSDESFEKAGG